MILFSKCTRALTFENFDSPFCAAVAVAGFDRTACHTQGDPPTENGRILPDVVLLQRIHAVHNAVLDHAWDGGQYCSHVTLKKD